MSRNTQPGTGSNPAFYALMVALVIMAMGPIVMMITTSLKLNVDVMSDSSKLLFMPTLQNYEAVLCDVLWYEPASVDYCDPTFGRALKNSLIIALISTAITLIVGTMAAYALVRFRFFGRGTMSMTALMMRMVPPAVLLVPVFGWRRTVSGVLFGRVATDQAGIGSRLDFHLPYRLE